MRRAAPATGSWRRVTGRVVFHLGLCCLGMGTMFALLQRKLIYFPDSRPVQPQQVGLAPRLVEQLQLPVTGAQLEGWWCRPEMASAQNRPVVILFPGNAANRGKRIKLIEAWNRLGCDVVIFDYRGYGGSTGSPSEANFTRDAQLIWNYVTKTKGIDPSRVIICGQSLGGAVSIRLASDLRQQEVRPGGLVVQYSFTSLVDAGRYHYPWLPVDVMLIDRYLSLQRIQDVECPLLILHGQQDRTVPIQQGEALFAAAPPQSHNGIDKRFVKLPKADHNNVMHVHGADVEAAFEEFLRTIRE